MNTNLAFIEPPQLVRCPRCELWLDESNFGICHARKSGKNLYCAICVREKIAASRQRLREYKAAHPEAPKGRTVQPSLTGRQIARLIRKLKPSDRVREAIRYGAKTQDEIQRATRLPKDDICESLAHLLLWSRDIRTDVIHNTRMYFINELGSAVRRQPVKHEPRSHGVSTIYFG